MTESFTEPSWVYSEPHPDAELQIGDEDPSNDVINRVAKRLALDLLQLYTDTYYDADLDGDTEPVLEKPIELRTTYEGIRRIRGGRVADYPESVAWPVVMPYANQVYVFGGGYGVYSSTGVNTTFNVRSYAVAKNEWIDRERMPYGVVRAGSALYDGKVYILGGRDDIMASRDTVQIYDLATDSWSFGEPLPVQRINFGCAVLDGKIHVVGGFEASSTPGTFVRVDKHEVYDPATDTWDEDSFEPYPVTVANNAMGAYNGKLYVFCGVDGASDDSCYVYDPASNDWTALTDCPDGLAGGHSAVLAPGPNGLPGFYVMGATGVTTTHVYYPDTDTWAGSGNRPDDVPFDSASPYAIGSGLCYLDGRIWKVGGYNSNENNPLATVLGLAIAAPLYEADKTGFVAARSIGGEGQSLVNLTTSRVGSCVGHEAGDEIGVTVDISWSSKAVSAQVIG